MKMLLLDKHTHLGYASGRSGGSGAAEPFKPRQVREEATVRRSFWVPPGCLPGFLLTKAEQW